MHNAPAPGSYRYVLRTIRAYDPTIPRQASTYEETVESLDITHPDGIRHPTIFLSTESARDRLTKDGWEDVTQQWLEYLDRQASPETPKPQRVKIKA